jgi:hypothetical protein
MPELKLPEVRIRGLREMKTDDIKKALSEVPRPDVKLSDLDPRSIDLTKIELPRVDLAAAANAVAERNPLRPRRRSRAPMVLAGLIIAGLGTLAVMNLGWLRARITEVVDRARTRMDASRVNDSLEPIPLEAGDYTGTVGIPIQADTFADTLPSASSTPTESAFGATNGTHETTGFDTGTTAETGFDTGSTEETGNEGEIRSY